MSVLTLDFETYFDKEFTLKKLTTENYIRDSRFELLCASVREGDMGSIAYRVTDPGFNNLFRRIPISAVVCHHAQFDGLILSHHLGLRPKFWFDTLSMARLVFPHMKSHSLGSLANYFNLPDKSVPYNEFMGKHAQDLNQDQVLYSQLVEGCNLDTWLTYSIFKKLLPMVPREELKVIDLTIRMFTEPVLRLNSQRVRTYVNELIIKQEQLLTQLGVTKEDLGSNVKFALLLEDMGIDPPVKMSPKTKKQGFAFAKTDPGMVDLLNHENERISLLAEARINTKSTIGETRGGRLLSMAERGALCIYLAYAKAHTFRWAGGDKLNFQNFPRGGELRKSLEAPEGFKIVVIDSAQIECRVLNWLAREEWVMDAFREKRDLYCEMASIFYGWLVTKEHKKERFLGKTLVLGAGYGVGAKKLKLILKQNGIIVSDFEAQKAINAYRSKHPMVVTLWNHADFILDLIHKGTAVNYNWGPMLVNEKSIILPNGACMDYSNINVNPETGKGYVLNNPRGTVNIYGGKLVENVVQALSRVIMSQAMLKIAATGYKILTTTHDEIVYLAPAEEADIALELGLEILKKPPAWCQGIPLDAEGGYASNYSK